MAFAERLGVTEFTLVQSSLKYDVTNDSEHYKVKYALQQHVERLKPAPNTLGLLLRSFFIREIPLKTGNLPETVIYLNSFLRFVRFENRTVRQRKNQSYTKIIHQTTKFLHVN